MGRCGLWLVCALAAVWSPRGLCAQVEPATKPAAVVACTQVQISRRAGVTTFTYGNGVRVYVRPTAAEGGGGRVVVQALVFGPELLETEANRGITSAAVIASRPTVGGGGAGGGERPERGGGGGVGGERGGPPGLRVSLTPEGISARWSGPNTDVGEGLARLTAWLTAPVVEEERLAAMRARRAAVMAAFNAGREGAASGPMAFERAALGLMGETIGVGVGGAGLPWRGRAVQADRPEFTAEACQAWLREQLAKLPLEVAISGPVTLEEAERLAREHLGGLPARGDGRPLGPETMMALRKAAERGAHAEPAADEMVRTVPVEGTGAMVFIAMPGPDMSDLAGVRRARVAARVLDSVLRPALEGAGIERRQMAVLSLPGRVVPGSGAMHIQVRLAGGREQAERAVEVVVRVVRELATGSPPESMVQPAAEASAKAAEQQEAGADYWPAVLALCGPYGLDPDQLADAPRAYRAMTPADVAAALRPAVGHERKLIVLPERPPTPREGALPASRPEDAPDEGGRGE